MTRTLRMRFSQVAQNGIFYDSRCLGEWRKVSERAAFNTRGQAVLFGPADVVEARGL